MLDRRSILDEFARLFDVFAEQQREFVAMLRAGPAMLNGPREPRQWPGRYRMPRILRQCCAQSLRRQQSRIDVGQRRRHKRKRFVQGLAP